jgi:hypothetical protein
MAGTTHQSHGRGPGGGRAQKPTNRRPEAPSLLLTGGTDGPSWPKSAPIEQRKALPRASSVRQAKADARLASKGGADWLLGGRRRERRMAA